MRRTILSAILAAVLCVSLCTFAVAAEKPENVVYNFNAGAVDTSDTSAWDVSQPNASLARVVGYGAHGWKYLGIGEDARRWIDFGGALNKMVNLDGSKFRVRASNGTPGTAGYFDTTSSGGTNMALSLQAPAKGWYGVAVYTAADGTGEVLTTSPLRTLALSLEKEGLSVDEYITEENFLNAGDAIYSDGKTPVILAVNVPSGNAVIGSAVLTPLSGKLTLSAESLNINGVGGKETVSVMMDGAPLVNGFVQFSSMNKNIATVSSTGEITGVSVGKTSVKVSTVGFSGVVEVTVNPYKAPEPVPQEKVYWFGTQEVDTGDPTSYDSSLPNAWAGRVFDYGNHGWKHFGYGKVAWDNVITSPPGPGPNGYLFNHLSEDIQIRALNDTVYAPFDIVDLGGTVAAVSIQPPAAGYYKARAVQTNGNGVGGEIGKAYLGKERGQTTDMSERVELVDSYVSDEYKLSADGSVVYSDGATPLILAFHVTTDETLYVQKFVMMPVSGEITLDTEPVILRRSGDTEKITVYFDGAPLSASCVEFYSLDEKVATVSASGEITAVGRGSTVIEVTSGDFFGAIEVTVGTAYVDDEEYVEAFTPDEIIPQPLLATVKTLAYATGAEKANVTTSAVKNDDGTYTVSAPEESPEGDKFLCWARGLESDAKKSVVSLDASFTYTPQIGANYLIAVYGESAELPAEEEYSVPENCRIRVNGNMKVYNYGDAVTCTASAKSGSRSFLGWKKTVNGVETLVCADTTYTFTAWEDCAVEAVYKNGEPFFSGEKRKIVLGELRIGNETAVAAEFIGFEDAVEKGITIGTKDYAMEEDGTQFTIINNIGESVAISGYAILPDGTKVIYNK